MTTSAAESGATEPNVAPILDLIEAFRRSKTMFAAVSMGVFDTAPLKVSEQTETMARLLDACVALGLLTRQEDEYRNTAASEKYLRRGGPDSLVGYILYSNEVLFRMWANLEDAVRDGTPRWKQTFDLDGPLFDAFFRNEESMRTFLLGMHGFGQLSSTRIAAAFDLSDFTTLCDLGGATGHLAAACCDRWSNLRGIVLDLPRVVAFGRTVTAHNRVEFVEGDFFEGPLPAADLYVLGRILHDWADDKVARLLGRIREALPDGGGALIAEKLLDGVPSHMQSLNMLVMTEGRERTFDHYDALVRAAGFRTIEARRTDSPLDAILVRK